MLKGPFTVLWMNKNRPENLFQVMEMHIVTCQKLNNLFLIAVCQRRHYFFMSPCIVPGDFPRKSLSRTVKILF